MTDPIDDIFGPNIDIPNSDPLAPTPSLWSRFKSYCSKKFHSWKKAAAERKRLQTESPNGLLRIKGNSLELNMEKFSKTPEFKKQLEGVEKIRKMVMNQQHSVSRAKANKITNEQLQRAMAEDAVRSDELTRNINVQYNAITDETVATYYNGTQTFYTRTPGDDAKHIMEKYIEGKRQQKRRIKRPATK